MAKVDVWMPLYVKDYLAATSRLTTEQHGAYMLLIMDYWMNGPLPDEDAALAQIARLSLEQWSKHRPSIERLFKVAFGQWSHTRIEKEIKAAQDRRNQAIERGKAGAKARWKSENKAGNGASIDQASPKQSSKDSSAPAPAQSNSVPNGTDAKALEEQIWDYGLNTVARLAGKQPNACRTILGKWRKQGDDRKVLDAIIAAEKQAVSDPVAWITASLAARTKPSVRDSFAHKVYEGTPDEEMPSWAKP